MAKRIAAVLLTALLIPYVVTLAWTGRAVEKPPDPLPISGKLILLDRKTGESYMDVEEYLPGVVARQIPVDYGREALRSQAIIARTYIYGKMNGADEIRESQLDLEYLEEKELKKLWGSESFVSSYETVEEAAASTAGMVITYDELLIEPLFHRASAGKTRTGDENHPYLQSVASAADVEAEGYLSVISFTKEEFVRKINQMEDGPSLSVGQAPSAIQIVVRDEAGYVQSVQAGVREYTGAQVQYALGLPSPAFYFEEYQDGIRAVCKGVGHGYGLSQYGAKSKAQEGWTAEEILSYFYKNIVLISE